MFFYAFKKNQKPYSSAVPWHLNYVWNLLIFDFINYVFTFLQSHWQGTVSAKCVHLSREFVPESNLCFYASTNLCTTTTRNFLVTRFMCSSSLFFFAAAHFHLRWPLAFPISWMHRLPNFLIHGAPLSVLCA